MRSVIALLGLLLLVPGAKALSKFEALDNTGPQMRSQPQTALRVGVLRSLNSAHFDSAQRHAERLLVEKLAARLRLPLQWLEYAEYTDLINALSSASIDLIAEPLPSAQIREQGFAATLTRHHSALMMADANAPRWAVAVGSPAWFYIKQNPVRDRPISVLPREQLWRQIAPQENAGDSAMSPLIPDLWLATKSGHTPFQNQPQAWAWAVRPQQRGLLTSINSFLRDTQLLPKMRPPQDFPTIARNGVLRVASLVKPESYFPWRGQLLGYDYEMLDHFCRQHQLRLEVLVANDEAEALRWLRQGVVDVAAAFLATSQIEEFATLRATTAYHASRATLVSKREFSPGQFGAMRVALSSQNDWGNVSIDTLGLERPAQWLHSDYQANSALLLTLDSHQADYVLLDEYLARLYANWRGDLNVSDPLPFGVSHAWAVRQSQPELLAALNTYLDSVADTPRQAMTYARYFSPDAGSDRFRDHYLAFVQGGQLSEYDALVKKYAVRHGFDWRLILAQIYQESQFDPEAVSVSNARGLMQIRTDAAKDMRLKNPFDPEQNIRAGVAYMDWLSNRFESALPLTERMWFSLAAYNGGLRHITTARSRASSMGLDPDRWFDHVEHAVTDLAQQPQAPFNPAKARQITDYVRRIQQRFVAYQLLTEDAQSATQVAARSTPRPTPAASVSIRALR